MKVCLLFFISAILLFSAGARKTNSALPAKHNVPSKASGASSEPEPAMWVDNVVLYKGEIVQLYFATPNAPYLGLLDPKGSFFYLVFPGESAMGELMPLVESKDFVALKTLKINTGTLKADPYTYGLYSNQPVFTISGTYTFILGKNLHVDDPGLLAKVTITYVHARAPAKVTPDTAMN